MPIRNRKTPAPPRETVAELPSPRPQDHAEYVEALERYQRIRQEHRELVLRIREVGDSQGRVVAGIGADHRDARNAHQVSAAEAYLNGDREAALAPPPPPSPSAFEQLQKEEEVARQAEALAHQRVKEAGELVAKRLCEAYRPHYRERLEAVLGALLELHERVLEAEELADAMRTAASGSRRPAPVVHLGEFLFSTRASAASILRRELKSLGIEED